MKTQEMGTPLGLRMPHDMRGWLKEQATANRRSLNSEILVILEDVRRNRTRQETAGVHAR
jgi:hypothetical protein